METQHDPPPLHTSVSSTSTSTNDDSVASKGGGKAKSLSKSPSDPSTKSFEFVLVTDSESRRQVRRHAMRQYMRQRRLEGIARLETTKVQAGDWNGGDLVQETPGPTDSDNDEPVQQETSTPIKADLSEIQRPPTIPTKSVARRRQSTPAPVTTLGAGHTDPFQSFPIQLKPADEPLIQHFVTTYPLMMYQMGVVVPYNPMRGIFHRFALHDQVPFQAMLAIAAKHKAGVEGQKDTVQSITHRMRALGLMNDRLKTDAGGSLDGTIYAAATMSVIEKWGQDSDVEHLHFVGVASMVKNRGGMVSIRRSNRFLESILYWVDFSATSKSITTASLPWSGNTPDIGPSCINFLTSHLSWSIPDLPPSRAVEDVQDIILACEQFISWFRQLAALPNSAVRSPQLHESTQKPTRSRARLFKPGSSLFTLLTYMHDYNHGIKNVGYLHEYGSMACLLYLSIELFWSRTRHGHFTVFLDWLADEMDKQELTWNQSITHLMWIFLKSAGYAYDSDDEGQRAWLVSRMLRVAKKLEYSRTGQRWEQVRNTLLAILAQHEDLELDGVTVEPPVHLPWEDNELRIEILGDLYSGPPLRVAEPASFVHLVTEGKVGIA